jgi:hypothetical protein
LINTIKNFSSAQGIKRIAKAKRFKDNVERSLGQLLGADEETRQYSPSYAQSRIILGKIGWKPEEEKEIIYTSPPLASLDGVYTLAEFLKGEPQGVIGGAIRPEFKSALGIEDKFSRELDEVPVEHINVLKAAVDNPVDSINLLLTGLGAEPIVGYENKEGRLVIPLNTPKQKKAYKKFMDAMSYAGVSTPLSDFSRTFLPEGTKVAVPEAGVGRGLAQLGFATAAATPMTYISPEKQAYYDRLSRLKDLQKSVGSIRVGEEERAAAISPPEEKIKERAEKRKEIKTKKKIAPTKRIRTAQQIRADYNSLKARRRAGLISAEEFKKRALELRDEARQFSN